MRKISWFWINLTFLIEDSREILISILFLWNLIAYWQQPFCTSTQFDFKLYFQSLYYAIYPLSLALLPLIYFLEARSWKNCLQISSFSSFSLTMILFSLASSLPSHSPSHITLLMEISWGKKGFFFSFPARESTCFDFYEPPLKLIFRSSIVGW